MTVGGGGTRPPPSQTLFFIPLLPLLLPQAPSACPRLLRLPSRFTRWPGCPSPPSSRSWVRGLGGRGGGPWGCGILPWGSWGVQEGSLSVLGGSSGLQGASLGVGGAALGWLGVVGGSLGVEGCGAGGGPWGVRRGAGVSLGIWEIPWEWRDWLGGRCREGSPGIHGGEVPREVGSSPGVGLSWGTQGGLPGVQGLALGRLGGFPGGGEQLGDTQGWGSPLGLWGWILGLCPGSGGGVLWGWGEPWGSP